MKVNGQSSYVLGNATRSWISKAQYELMRAQYEATEGRYYDMSGALGYKVGRLLDVQMQSESLTAFRKENALLNHRLDIAQKAMDSLCTTEGKTKGVLQNFLDTVMGSAQDPTHRVASAIAKQSIQALIGALNTTFNGEFVFGGKNGLVPPMKDYEPGSGKGVSGKLQKLFDDFVKQHVQDGNVNNITEKQLEEFMNGPFSKEFEGEAWKENFSNASDEIESHRIGPNGEKVPNGISANAEGFRAAMKAMAFIAELSTSKVAPNVLARMAHVASGVVAGHALIGVLNEQSQIGVYQSRVATLDRYMGAQLEVLNKADHTLGSVDGAEASTRISQYQASLSIAYEITGRISKLTLANYI